MQRINLFEALGIPEGTADRDKYIVESFSAGGFCPEAARQALEMKYATILEVTKKFDRRSVSYQLSKNDALHSWLKYKEGFSADLVNTLLDAMAERSYRWTICQPALRNSSASPPSKCIVWNSRRATAASR